ncbi:MAG: GWxTD domain-containing protein [Cytophagales bacterium]
MTICSLTKAQEVFHFFSNQLPVIRPQKVNCNVSYTTKFVDEKFTTILYLEFFPKSHHITSLDIPFVLQVFDKNDKLLNEKDLTLKLERKENNQFEARFELNAPTEDSDFIRLLCKDEKNFGFVNLNIPYDLKQLKDKPVEIVTHNNFKNSQHKISVLDTFHIVHQSGEVYLHYFSAESFLPSNVPFAKPSNYAPKAKKIEKVETQKPLVLKEPGLYVFTLSDSLKEIKNWLFCSRENFPRLKNINDLIDPLCYLFSPSEMINFKKSANKKLMVDSLWLKIAGNMDYAKKLISTYYGRVQYANETFSIYKEGWKTDQGMIYTIFGPPDEIINESVEQQWIYKDRKNDLSFVFVSKRTPLGIYEFVLSKSKDYEREWNNTVEKWRKGIVE